MKTQNNEWLKQKLFEQEVNKWIAKFNQAEGNKEEWKKIYQDYLKSNVWAEKRKQVLSRANGKCEGDKCGVTVVSDSLLDVHHLTYDRVGGKEEMSDLKALCYSCHQKADRKRDNQIIERRGNRRYESRLNSYACKKFGVNWESEQDEAQVEIAFITFLYKGYCKKNDLDFDPHFDPEIDEDFLDFWDMVLDGDK